MQDTVGTDSDGKEMSLLDKVATEDESVFEEVNLRLQISQLYREMKKVLSQREKRILEMRYGLCGAEALTQKEISAMMGISRSYVSRLEKKAMKKLFKSMNHDE